MSNSKISVEKEQLSGTIGNGDESEDEREVLEESPCGRWHKRREEVSQRDVPGIDNAFLAMDNEEGVEVVWNEVQISEQKASVVQMETLSRVFDNLIHLQHANIVKFHKYWTDKTLPQWRLIFITEYMSSGSLRQFLKKTKKSSRTLKAWRRWCRQILYALSYLHSCDPPIVHGNLTTDTIFIQQNGLVKIGCVAPDAVYSEVKTQKEESHNWHYFAPEYEENNHPTPATDIYAFGICALEMVYVEATGNGDSHHGGLTDEKCHRILESLEDPDQKDFIARCLRTDPRQRPTARQLLFHRLLFEVHTLKLLAAHTFIKHAHEMPSSPAERVYRSALEPSMVIAEMTCRGEHISWTTSQVQTIELEEFLDEVKTGIYPLTAYPSSLYPPPPVTRTRPASPEGEEQVKTETPEPGDVECRHIVSLQCQLDHIDSVASVMHMTIMLRLNDRTSRQLSCDVTTTDTSDILVDELIQHGFVHADDKAKLTTAIEDTFRVNGVHQSVPNGCGSESEYRVQPQSPKKLTQSVSTPARQLHVAPSAVTPAPVPVTTAAAATPSHIASVDCHMEPPEVNSTIPRIAINVQLADGTKHELLSEIAESDTPAKLADDLVDNGLVLPDDAAKLAAAIDNCLKKHRLQQQASNKSAAQH